MPTAAPLPEDALQWMERFAACVRARDYEAARPLFARGVSSFGTVAFRADGLDDLVDRQWREVWDVTEGFDFDYARARTWNSGDLVCVATSWASRGVPGGGAAAERIGRVTLLLTRDGSGRKAVHTHFSLDPAVEGRG